MLQLEKINAYYGESHILRDVSFTIDSGEVVCLMGRNGVGKTTTLKVLTGLLPARSGRMMFDGADVTKEATDGRARRGLAYVPQGREILPHLTVRENFCSASGRGRTSRTGRSRRPPSTRSITSFPSSHKFSIVQAAS